MKKVINSSRREKSLRESYAQTEEHQARECYGGAYTGIDTEEKPRLGGQ